MKRIQVIISAILILSVSLCLSACSGEDKTESAKKGITKEQNIEKDSSLKNDNTQENEAVTGYESEKYNLVFTPPESFVMFNSAEINAQAVGQTKYEMVSEHEMGNPRVMVIAETTDAPDVDSYLENLRAVVSSSDFVLSEISDFEIAGRIFRGFIAERSDGIIQSFYAEKAGDEYVCISISDEKDFLTDETVVIPAFSSFN